MERFTVLTGTAAPLMLSNVDTGAMITSEAVRDYPKDKLGTQLFANWRFDRDGAVKPDFVLNDPRYAACSIMIAGPNFGCGSSRETAVWALMNYGIRCVIASSFGEIFYENCFQNGLLPVTLTEKEVEAIARRVEAAPKPEMTVDLVACRIDLPDGSQYPFSLASDRREALLEGLDAFDILLRKLPDIEAFQAQDAEQRPWIFARHVDGDAVATADR